jgi:hypothetical protein
MDELTLLAEMRKEIPVDSRYPAAQRALMAEIAGGGAARAQRRRAGRPILISGLLAGAVAASVVVTSTMSGSGHGRHAPPGALPRVHLAAVTSPMSLAGNAATLAQHAPVPAASQWVYVKLESAVSKGKPSGATEQVRGMHKIRETWTRVDLSATAYVKGDKVVTVQNTLPPGASMHLEGWPKPITYSYLNSLPTDPVKLLEVIRQNSSADFSGTGDQACFSSVLALMENYPVLPPKLQAGLYGVLAHLKSVHLRHRTDIAGRKVLSLDYVTKNGITESILVNPATYAYAGQRAVVTRNSSNTDTAGKTLRLRKGELLDDEAVLVSRIVNTAGTRS